MIKYQFNVDQKALNEVQNISVEKSRKSNRIKEFSVEGERWGTIRASDSIIVPGKPMIMWLHQQLSFPQHRVIMSQDGKEFILDGKSAFCKFCEKIDMQLRPGDECLIVTSEDELLGWGQVQYTNDEIQSFSKGIVVKTRAGMN